MSKQQCQHTCQHMHWFSRYQHFNLTCFLFSRSWRTPFQLTGKDVSMSCKLTKHCLIICFLYLISCQYIKSKFQRFLFFSRTRRRAVYLCIKKKKGQEPLQHTPTLLSFFCYVPTYSTVYQRTHV